MGAGNDQEEWFGGLGPLKECQGLDVISVRKHVKGLHVREAVPREAGEEAAKIPNQSLGIAGHVGQAQRAGCKNRGDGPRMQAGAGRIDDDQVRLGLLKPETPVQQHRFHPSRTKLHVAQAVQ